jgi:hypothetical protein
MHPKSTTRHFAGTLGGLPPGTSMTVGLTFATDVSGTFWFNYAVDTLGLN